MARSHPPTLLTVARRTLADECGLERGERLLVAVSGGPDSCALLHVLAGLRQRFGFELHAHGIDHGLRPEARAELDLAESLAAQCGVAFSRSRVAVAAGGNLQARARDARYAELRRVLAAARCTRIATAHHADDRAETVLLRLMRGAGPEGLAVLPPRESDRIRPLIRAGRADVLLHLTRHGITFAEDPSNSDRRYLRARVRFELMPLLREMSPGIVPHLTALADALAAGPAPAVFDADGARVPLKRAHITAIRRALASKNTGARVPLPHGRAVRLVDAERGTLRVEGRQAGRQGGGPGPRNAPPRTDSAARKTELRAPRTSRGANPRKSG